MIPAQARSLLEPAIGQPLWDEWLRRFPSPQISSREQYTLFARDLNRLIDERPAATLLSDIERARVWHWLDAYHEDLAAIESSEAELFVGFAVSNIVNLMISGLVPAYAIYGFIFAATTTAYAVYLRHQARLTNIVRRRVERVLRQLKREFGR